MFVVGAPAKEDVALFHREEHEHGHQGGVH